MSEWKELDLDSKNFEWAIDMSKEEYADYRYLHLKYRKLEPNVIKGSINFNGETGEVLESTGILKNTRVIKKGVGIYVFKSADIPPEAL